MQTASRQLGTRDRSPQTAAHVLGRRTQEWGVRASSQPQLAEDPDVRAESERHSAVSSLSFFLLTVFLLQLPDICPARSVPFCRRHTEKATALALVSLQGLSSK